MERASWILGAIGMLLLAVMIGYGFAMYSLVKQARESRHEFIDTLYKKSVESIENEIPQGKRLSYLRYVRIFPDHLEISVQATSQTVFRAVRD